MKSKILGLLAVGLLTGPMAANATAISYGALSSNDDGSTQIITDTLNNREWLRWNGPQLGLTYAQTLAAIAPGGSLEGWSIAQNVDAQLFTDALLYGQPNYCTVVNNADCRSYLPATLTTLVGDNYNSGADFAFFLSDDEVGAPVGMIRYQLVEYPTLSKFNSWADVSAADRYATCNGCQIGWLLYRSASVPEPATLALLGLGLAGLGLSRRKKSA